MKKEEFIQKLNTMDAEMEAELREMLDEEMKKPVKKRDAAMIAELTGAITEICGFSTENICNDESISKISGKVTETGRKRKSISVRRISALAACAALLFGLNQASLSAFGENVFSRVYHFTKGGVSIMIGENENTEPTEPPTAPPATDAAAPEEEVIELPTYPGDPYGFKAICAEYGLFPMAPTYIPEGFKLVEVFKDDDSKTTEIEFKFTRNDEMIFLIYFLSKSGTGSFGIPHDSGQIQEVELNGSIFATFKEDNQFKALCEENHFIICYQSFNVDYEESEKIFYSMK